MKFFKAIFGEGGDRQDVPDDAQLDGTVSYESGYGQDYSRDLVADPEALAIQRAKYNQVLNDVTGSLQLWQTSGIPDFINPEQNGGDPYPYNRYALCTFDVGTGAGRTIFISTENINVTSPSDVDAKWKPLISEPLTWVPDFYYSMHAVVSHESEIYFSKFPNNNNNPPSVNSPNWDSLAKTMISGELNAPYFIQTPGQAPGGQYAASRDNNAPRLISLIEGQQILFRPTYANIAQPTLTMTLSDDSEVTHPIVYSSTGHPLAAAAWPDASSSTAIQAYTLIYDASAGWVYNAPQTDPGAGLTLLAKTGMGAYTQYSTVNPTKDIIIGAGHVMSSDGDTVLSLPSDFRKRDGVTWVKGSSAGALLADMLPGSFGYVFVMKEDSTGDIDVGIDDNPAGANIPVGWSKRRAISVVFFLASEANKLCDFIEKDYKTFVLYGGFLLTPYDATFPVGSSVAQYQVSGETTPSPDIVSLEINFHIHFDGGSAGAGSTISMSLTAPGTQGVVGPPVSQSVVVARGEGFGSGGSVIDLPWDSSISYLAYLNATIQGASPVNYSYAPFVLGFTSRVL